MNSIIERVNLACRNVRYNNAGPITFKKLVSQTRKSFKDHDFDIAIKTKKDLLLYEDGFYVMAYYDAHDDQNFETPIEVVIHHNFTNQQQFAENQITDFLIQVFDAVVHEYKHRDQSIKRNFKQFADVCYSPYREYLSDPDELDAYALSIAIELARTIGVERAKRNLPRIRILSKMRQGTGVISPNLRSYIEHFDFGPLLKKLSKKIYKHLETLDTRALFL